jgi:hypothetical protein
MWGPKDYNKSFDLGIHLMISKDRPILFMFCDLTTTMWAKGPKKIIPFMK